MSVLDAYKGYFLDTPRTREEVLGPEGRPSLAEGGLLIPPGPTETGPRTTRQAIQAVLDNRVGPLLPIDELTIVNALNERAEDLLRRLRAEGRADYIGLLAEMGATEEELSDEDAIAFITGHMFEALKSE